MRGISPSQGRCLTQTQNKRKHVHASSGIRTSDPRAGETGDISCLRGRPRCDRQPLYS
jgi:hypothetical protein